jgi:hypothetical protein
MSRPLEDILFGAPSPRAQTVTRAVSMIAAAVLFLLAAGIGLRFYTAGQFEARFWEFFAWQTTWAFLAKGLLGTLASAAMAAVIALAFGLVLLLGRLARPRLVRWLSIAVIEFLRGTPTLLLIYVSLHCPGAGRATGHRGQGHHLRLRRHLRRAHAERQGAHRQLPRAGARVPRCSSALLPGELRDITGKQTARRADALTVTRLLKCR